MGEVLRRIACALVGVVLMGATTAWGAEGKKPAAKLVPFPEDEVAVEAKPAAPRLAQPVAPKSNFQPRFKSPAIPKAQAGDAAIEPAKSDEGSLGPELPAANASEAAADSSETNAKKSEPVAHSNQPAAGRKTAARALIDEAFAKSKTAAAEKDFTEVIDSCRRGIKLGLKKNYDDYARRLLGWAYNRRGEVRAEAGRDQDALVDFEAAVKLAETWRAVHNRGVSYASLGRTQEAVADFNRTIEMNPKYTNAYFNRGELHYKQGNFPGAIDDYTAAMKLAPPDAALFNSRGHAFYQLQQFGEALDDYGEALKLDPGNPAILVNRGNTFADLGRFAEAAKDFRTAVLVAPKSGRAYQSAAWFMATCPDQHYRNDKLALEAAHKAIEIDGENYRNLETLAAAQASIGQFAEAKETQEKAIALASRQELVTAEKRMALYARDIAYREQPRTATGAPEDLASEVRQASGTEAREKNGKWPNRQAVGGDPLRPTKRPARPNLRYPQ